MSLNEIISDFDLLKPMVLRVSVQSGLIKTIASKTVTLDGLLAICPEFDPYLIELIVLALAEYGYIEINGDRLLLSSKGLKLAAELKLINDLTSKTTAAGVFSYAPIALQERLEGGIDYFKKYYKVPYWTYVDSKPELYLSFDNCHESFVRSDILLDREQVASLEIIRKSGSLLELGSGYGDMGYFILQHQDFRGKIVLSDLPNRLSSLAAQPRWSNLDGRVKFIPINFFFDRIPDSDIVLLDSIFADWDDNNSILILKNIHDSIRTRGSKVIVSEVISFSDVGSVDIFGKLNLACASSGKVRTCEEIIKLMKTAGFDNVTLLVDSPCRFTVVGYISSCKIL